MTSFPRTIRDSGVVSPSRMIVQGDASRSGFGENSKRIFVRLPDGFLVLIRAGFLVVIQGRRTCCLRTGMLGRRRRRNCFIPLLKYWALKLRR